MNGVHDLGGMHGFGPITRDEQEPVFHADWEAVMVAVFEAARRAGCTIDELRHGIERMDPVHYLNSTYYEHWYDGISRVLIERGIVDEAALAARATAIHDGAVAAAARHGAPTTTGAARALVSFRREGPLPRFQPGDTIVTRRFQPTGHTRLPRYARGRRGVIDRVRGAFVFPDSNAHGQGEQPQPLYSVRFTGAELWGESAEPRQTVYLDLWESYLLPA